MPAQPRTDSLPSGITSNPNRETIERNIVALVFGLPSLYEAASASVGPDWFVDRRLSTLFGVFGELFERKGGDFTPDDLLVELTASQRLKDAGGEAFLMELAGSSNLDQRSLPDWIRNLAMVRAREKLATQSEGLAIAARTGKSLSTLVADMEDLTEEVKIVGNSGASRLPVMTLDEIMAAPADSMEWLVEGMLPRQGVIVLGGKQKQGKTLLAQQMSLSVVDNLEVLGHEVDNPGPVVFVGLEGSRGSFITRIQGQCRGLGISTAGLPFHLITRPKRELPTINSPLWMELEALCAAIHPRMLVIDPLIWISSADESDNAAMARTVMLPLQQFAVRHDCLVLIVHHMKKPAGEDKGKAPSANEWQGGLADKIRGASAITAGTDGNLVFEEIEGGIYRLAGELRDAPQFICYLRRDPDTLIYELTDAPSKPSSNATANLTDIVFVLGANKSPRGMTIGEIAETAGCSWATAKAAIGRAEKAHQVINEKVGSRFYFRLAPGVTAPAPEPPLPPEPLDILPYDEDLFG